MSEKLIYHGSNVSVPHPKILINGYYKDFGYGFYCTNLAKQAKRWRLLPVKEVNSYDQYLFSGWRDNIKRFIFYLLHVRKGGA